MRTVALYLMLFGLTTLAIGAIELAGGGDALLYAAMAIAGVILIGSGLRTQKGWRPGLYTGLVVSLVLITFFGNLFVMRDAPFMPSGLIMLMGILALVLIALVLVQPRERKRDF